MKTFITPLVTLAFLFILMSFQNGTILCNAKELKEKASGLLDPYKYDSSEMTKILYKPKESVKEVVVPLFIGEKYRFVFEMEALPKHVEVEIYNKDKDSKNRKLLFSSKESNADKKEFQFDVTRIRTVYIDYIVPATESGAYTGCAVFMLGYRLK